MGTWLRRKFQAQACKFEVWHLQSGRTISKHLTEDAANRAARKCVKDSNFTANYFVRPIDK